MTMRAAARAEFEKREREEDARRLEHEVRLCEEAVRDAYRVFGFHADTAVYNRSDRRVELEFDQGAVKIALKNPGCPSERQWQVIFACERCGAPVPGHIVETLADIGQALEEGADPVDYDHYCAPREGRQLSEYLAEEVA